MFTGIITEQGSVESLVLNPAKDSAVLTIKAGEAIADLELGGSLAVNGVCLTAVESKPGVVSVDVMGETLTRTTTGELKAGASVNLERCVPAGGRMDGHVVQGHVDGVGALLERENMGDWERLRDKTNALRIFDIDWWLDDLVRILGRRRASQPISRGEIGRASRQRGRARSSGRRVRGRRTRRAGSGGATRATSVSSSPGRSARISTSALRGWPSGERTLSLPRPAACALNGAISANAAARIARLTALPTVSPPLSLLMLGPSNITSTA